jgi:hypothetical protein
MFLAGVLLGILLALLHVPIVYVALGCGIGLCLQQAVTTKRKVGR